RKHSTVKPRMVESKKSSNVPAQARAARSRVRVRTTVRKCPRRSSLKTVIRSPIVSVTVSESTFRDQAVKLRKTSCSDFATAGRLSIEQGPAAQSARQGALRRRVHRGDGRPTPIGAMGECVVDRQRVGAQGVFLAERGRIMIVARR